MEIKTITTSGITLALEDHGPNDAVPLILIRGQGSQMAHWPRELINGFLSAGFRTVIFDNRDVGLSQRCPVPGVLSAADEIIDQLKSGKALSAPYSISDMAQDVTGLMDELEIDRAHVFGISMGGMIAQQIIVQAPERLCTATIVMSSCRPVLEYSVEERAAAIERAEKLLVKPFTREEYLASQVREHSIWGSPGYPMSAKEIRAIASLAYDRGVDADGMNRQIVALAGAPDRRPGLAKTSVPCLVIHGVDDTLVPVERGREIAEIIPSSRFHAIPGMGHIITPALAPMIVEKVTDFIIDQVEWKELPAS